MSSTLNIVTRLGLQESQQKSGTPKTGVAEDMPVSQPQHRLNPELEAAFNEALKDSFSDSLTPLD